MKRTITALTLIIFVVSLLSACNFKELPNLNDLNNTGDPESYFEYGFMDECSDGTKYLKIESFEISTLNSISEHSTNNTFFVVLGVTTNLTENDFSNHNNLVELWVSPSQMVNLRFKSFDAENKKLVYEIPESDTLDYTTLPNLNISDSNDAFSNLSIILDVYNTYCVVNDMQYCGRLIKIPLEYVDLGQTTVPDEEPGSNDIFYAAAYPEDFEYNGRHYRLVQGNEWNTPATQEELGELLGYIIREEDISAFTKEYPGADYVIDNGIYDYETNNRVAFYSLKAYPDISIICMRQLGSYVLFQSEGEQDLQFKIQDRAEEENLPCDDALEKFYEDASNEYYFSAVKSQYVVVIYSDGSSEDIVTALNAGRVTIGDLDEFGIRYYINPKQ